MCGITHVKRFNGKRAAKMVIKRYHAQEARGKEGYGFVGLEKGKVARYYRDENWKPTRDQMLAKQEDEILFHHRNPTSTPNFEQTAHPIFVEHKDFKHDYYIVHNGSLRDIEEMKAEHEKQGFVYTTLIKEYWLSADKQVHAGEEKWNDSETFAIELAKDLEGAKEGLYHLSGVIAFVAMQVDKKSGQIVKLYWGRNYGAPLKTKRTTDYFTITSEGSGDDVPEHTLNWYDYKTNKIEKLEARYSIGITTYSSYGYKGGTYAAEVNKPDWSSSKRLVGFQREPETLPLLGAPKIVIPEYKTGDASIYIADTTELEGVNEMLSRAGKDPETDEWHDYLLERREQLIASIKDYEIKHPIPSPYQGA